MSPLHRTFAALVVFLVVATACSGSDGDDTTTSGAIGTTSTTTAPASSTTVSTTTTMATTTTQAPGVGAALTTLPPSTTSPMNGVAALDTNDLDRRVIAVKIDNHARARPQSGIQNADAVIEMRVEAGLTRFIALFHDNDATYVGPIRSIRPTDSAVIRPLDGTLFVSGGQQWIQELSVARGIRLLGEGTGTFRISSREAPHNLYGDTTAFRDRADSLGFDDDFGVPLFELGDWELPDDEAEEIRLTWSDETTVTWRYEDDEYVRHLGTSDTSHDWIDSQGTRAPITTDVLVVVTGEFSTTLPPGDSGSGVPSTSVVGSGDAYVFAAGRVWQGSWERDAIDETFRLVDSEGNDAVVPPGTPWISVFPSESTITWS